MNRLKQVIGIGVLLAALVAPLLVAGGAAQAQGPGWLQVWYVRGVDGAPDTIEYRDAGGTVLVAYTFDEQQPHWEFNAGWRLIGSILDTIMVFDPMTARIDLYLPQGMQPSTGSDTWMMPAVLLSPDGQRYAYTVNRQPADFEQPAESWVYVATIGAGDDRVVYYEETESFMAITPVGWSADGTQLLLDRMPQGIGGYILFWTYQDTRVLDLASGATTPFGNADGFADGWSDDLRMSASLEQLPDEAYVLNVTDHAIGETVTYLTPPLNEVPGGGGGAVFSPGGTRVAYQLARYHPENERFWTIVIDLDTAMMRVVLDEEFQGWDAGYGQIGGWLDGETLVIGNVWGGEMSAVVNAATGEFLREERGAFLGYAVGLADASGLAPSGPVTSDCPGAPPSRLEMFTNGRITFTSGTDTNVRAAPGTGAEVIASMPEGATFRVHAGPFCADGYAWWKLAFDDEVTGFVAEGMPGEYWLEPQ